MSLLGNHHREPGRVRAIELGTLNALRFLNEEATRERAPDYVLDALLDIEGWWRTRHDEPETGVQRTEVSDP